MPASGVGLLRYADTPNLPCRERLFKRKLSASPCVDAGSNGVPGLPEKDVRGMYRVLYGGKMLEVDIGAYEFHIWPPSLDPQTGDATVTWSSLTGKTYCIYRSSDMLTWELSAEGIGSNGDTVTTWIDPGAGLRSSGVLRRYYKATESP